MCNYERATICRTGEGTVKWAGEKVRKVGHCETMCDMGLGGGGGEIAQFELRFAPALWRARFGTVWHMGWRLGRRGGWMIWL